MSLSGAPRRHFIIVHVYNDALAVEGEDVSRTSFVCSTDHGAPKLFCWHSAFSEEQYRTKTDIDRAIYLPDTEYSFRLSWLLDRWGMNKNDVTYSDIELYLSRIHQQVSLQALPAYKDGAYDPQQQ